MKKELLFLLILIIPLITAIPNPASVYCEEQGGTSIIARCSFIGSENEGWYNTLTDELIELASCELGEIGYCQFTDGSLCEEWAYYRGECSPQELICCESYGWGANMIKCCETYEWTTKEECVRPEGFTGGGRTIVDNSYCISDETKCENVGGTWKQFTNGCVDSCELVRQDLDNPITCGQAFTYGCDCGEDQCWNGEACEANNCVEEGEKGNTITNPNAACCSGLTMLTNSQETAGGGCIAPTDGSFICSYCGNDICGLGENECNCPEDCETSDTGTTTLTQAQIQKIKQLKNRLQIHLNATECPENCTCTGSTTKCGLKGDRTMTITAGQSGNVIVQVKGVNASTNVTLYKSEEKLYGVFKDNETKRIMTPEQVQEKIRERKQKTWEEHNITLDEEGYYRVQSKKKARLFFLIPVREKVKTQMNAETGEIIKIRNPWWGFLANDIKEEPLVGASCGTVNPDYVDECCVNKGYDAWDADTNECVFEAE